jgi:hypothetical protein
MPLLEFSQINLVFHGVCFFVVILYSISSVRDFLKNDDLCEVSFRTFHKDEKSSYPSFTMCLNTPFADDELKKFSSKLSSLSYEAYLTGRQHQDFQTFTNISYTDVTIQNKDLLVSAFVMYKDYLNKSLIDTEMVSTHSWPWRSCMMKCFSFEVPFKKDNLADYLSIWFNNTIFPNGTRPNDGWSSRGLQVFVHYPNQFGRSYKNKRRFWKTRYSNDAYRMRFYFKGMEVLEKRHKPYDKCEEDTPYDEWLVQHIVEIIQCRPPYWNVVGNFSVCVTPDQLGEATKLFSEFFYGVQKWLPPCTEIKKVDLNYRETEERRPTDPDQTRIVVYFETDSYKDIRQIRAYPMMSLFGNVGGFVGLFMGNALVKFPSFVRFTFAYMKRH